MSQPLNELAREIHGIARAKGFWPVDASLYVTRNPGEILMLIVSEAAEALEAIRDGCPLSELLWVCPADAECECGEEPCTGTLKPDGVPAEMADILIRVLDACHAWGIDIDTVVREKIRYNAQRPHLHGRAL